MVEADTHLLNDTENDLRLPEELLEKIQNRLQRCSENQRLIVGIAGAPASGKSTLAQWLVERLNASEMKDQELAVVVPMDGFHFDNSILDRRGLRAVKGAPHTFDVDGFRYLLDRLSTPLLTQADHRTGESASAIYIPVFDREIDLARNAASSVENHHKVVVLEGNYLLLKRPVWRDLVRFISLSVFLDVPESVLEQRLIQRWLDHGLSLDAARARALSNDIPNAHVVMRESATAHLRLKSVRQ